MSRFAKVNLLEIEDSAAGRVEGVEARFGRKYLESRDLGVSHFRYAANLRSSTAHSHKGQEEAYVVVAGSGRILLDEETQELHLWDVIRVAPEVVRAFEAGPEGLDLIAVGGPKERGRRWHTRNGHLARDGAVRRAEMRRETARPRDPHPGRLNMAPSTTPTPAEHEHGHPRIVLATLALANVMGALDLFIVNVALNDIGSDLHQSISDVAWVLNAYALFFGALLIPAGRFGDKYGRKNVFMIGLAVFTIASLACAVSPNLWVLVAFRCVQAAGAAMLIPSSLGLVLTTMPPARIKSSVRLWAVSGAAAGAIGPVVGGLLTSLSWRWIFLINLPIGIAAIAITWKMIPNVRHDLSTKMPDPIGSLMAILTIGAISFGLLNGQTWGWGGGRIMASWAVAIVAAVVFVISTRRAAVPVIEPQMFRSRVFRAANVSAVIGDGDLRDAAARDEPVPAAVLALVDDRHRPGDRTRAGGDPDVVVRGAETQRETARGSGRGVRLRNHRRRPDPDVAAPQGRRTQLRRRHPPGLDPDRHRVRILAADDHGLSDP